MAGALAEKRRDVSLVDTALIFTTQRPMTIAPVCTNNCNTEILPVFKHSNVSASTPPSSMYTLLFLSTSYISSTFSPTNVVLSNNDTLSLHRHPPTYRIPPLAVSPATTSHSVSTQTFPVSLWPQKHFCILLRSPFHPQLLTYSTGHSCHLYWIIFSFLLGPKMLYNVTFSVRFLGDYCRTEYLTHTLRLSVTHHSASSL